MKTWKIAILVSLVLAACMITLLVVVSTPKKTAGQQSRPVKQEMVWIRDYGQGVYYFAFTGDEFRKSVAGFLKLHPNLEVAACDGDVVRRNEYGLTNSDYGATVGHTVFFREKK